MRDITKDILLSIQGHFHEVIRERAGDLIEEHKLVLPELARLLRTKKLKAWFRIPGMCGGFSYWLEDDGLEIKLISESWCRVVGGSGQRHEVTVNGSRLVEEGFV